MKIRLQEQSFQILAALLERPGKLVTRDVLRERLWPDSTFVDFEKGLNIAVSKLRQALGDSADQPRLIETLPRRGYRFIGPVELVDSGSQVVGLPEGAAAEHVISHYRLLEKLGEGGMGVVYKALDTNLNRTVALKFLAPRLTQDPEAKKRFRREAEAAAAVDHPNICTVHEIAEVDGQIFIAMAYIEGQSLDKKIGGSPLPLDQAFDIAAQTAQGLQAAHEKGVVHRDIKSANILLTTSGQVKIVDFGLAQLANPDQLTKTGSTLGTPAYMSPEQARWEKVDRRTDIWSLGVVLYEMVGGRLPFRGEVQQAMMHSILHADPDPLTGLRTGVPIELDYLIDKALAKERDERYQHVDEVLVDLRELQKEQPSGIERLRTTPGTARPRPRGQRKKPTKAWVGAAAAVVMAITAAVFWNFGPTTTEPPLEPMRPVPLTTYPGAEMLASFSPDGNQVAFPWTGGNTESFDIYVKVVGPGPPLRLTTHPDWDGSPAWSPDGRWIAFLRGRPEDREKMGLYLISPLGGRERKLAETRLPFNYMAGNMYGLVSRQPLAGRVRLGGGFARAVERILALGGFRRKAKADFAARRLDHRRRLARLFSRRPHARLFPLQLRVESRSPSAGSRRRFEPARRTSTPNLYGADNRRAVHFRRPRHCFLGGVYSRLLRPLESAGIGDRGARAATVWRGGNLADGLPSGESARVYSDEH